MTLSDVCRDMLTAQRRLQSLYAMARRYPTMRSEVQEIAAHQECARAICCRALTVLTQVSSVNDDLYGEPPSAA